MTSGPLEDQGEFLATRWMSVKQLTEAGIPCRRGRFTKEETQKIRDTIQTYQKEHNLDDEQLDDLIHSVEPAKGFWSYIGKVGKWSAAEDQQLQMAVQSHGKDWTAIADFVQRTAADCSDWFHQHIQYKETKWTGAWLLDEESQLVHAMEVLAWGGKSDMSAAGFWVFMSKKIGGTRTPKQCQSKWSEMLEGKARNKDQRRCWTKDDSYVLICKIASLDLDNDSDIDWKSLSDPSWNMWTGHHLQQKWRWLKASYNADRVTCHRGLCDKINVYVQQTSTHIRGLSPPPSPSSSSLPQCLEGPLGVRVIVLRPDCLLSLVHITHLRDRMLAKPGSSSPPSVVKAHRISFVFEWEARSDIGAAFAAGRRTGWSVDADAISLRELLVPCEMLAASTSICTIVGGLMTCSRFLLYWITWVRLKV
ncbi:hypothetical protein EI94DRAFT_1706477 [Lactarius quietus]|nr:hypothetical protein EI94DRAFT_1706477 [Lactarius quietus]